MPAEALRRKLERRKQRDADDARRAREREAQRPEPSRRRAVAADLGNGANPPPIVQKLLAAPASDYPLSVALHMGGTTELRTRKELTDFLHRFADMPSHIEAWYGPRAKILPKGSATLGYHTKDMRPAGRSFAGASYVRKAM